MAQHDNVIEFGNEENLSDTRPRVRFKRALFSAFIISVILIIFYITTPISRLGVVYFEGLNALTRSDLITLVDIGTDDLFFRIRLSEVRNRIEAHPVVNEAQVRRTGLNRLRITVSEYEVGACAVISGNLFHILTDGTLLDENENMRVNCAEMMIHGLTEVEIEQGIASLFVRQLMRVDPQIRNLIQTINHEPLYGDVYRFSLSMLDGNDVKVTTHTMHEYLNLYQSFLEGIIWNGFEHGQTGVLNLDVGFNFVPHE